MGAGPGPEKECAVAQRPGGQSKRPRYLELADALRADILAGKFAQPDVFPTEAELCETHGVSRFTIREALRKLQTEGLIARRHGSGTVIQPAAARAGALHQPLSNVAEILQYARDTRIAYHHLGPTRIPRRYAEQIGIDPGGSWHLMRGVRTRPGDDAPIALTDAYLHADLASPTTRIEADGGAIFEQIESAYGLSVARVTQDIQAVPATAEIAAQLDVPRRSPCLRIMRCYMDTRGRIFEISINHHPGDRFAYAMHIDVEG